MASGCIMGDCAICGDHVWEDEWSLDRKDRLIHSGARCRRNYIRGEILSKTTENGITTIVIKEDIR